MIPPPLARRRSWRKSVTLYPALLSSTGVGGRAAWRLLFELIRRKACESRTAAARQGHYDTLQRRPGAGGRPNGASHAAIRLVSSTPTMSGCAAWCEKRRTRYPAAVDVGSRAASSACRAVWTSPSNSIARPRSVQQMSKTNGGTECCWQYLSVKAAISQRLPELVFCRRLASAQLPRRGNSVPVLVPHAHTLSFAHPCAIARAERRAHSRLQRAGHRVPGTLWVRVYARTSRSASVVPNASAIACSRESRRPCAHAAANASSPSAARTSSIAWRC
jgi:hypothetical protein